MRSSRAPPQPGPQSTGVPIQRARGYLNAAAQALLLSPWLLPRSEVTCLSVLLRAVLTFI